MGIAKKTDGRYVVGLGVTDANDYKGSASYRDIYIQLTSSGATAKSEEYLTFLKDYAINANALGEPIMPPSVNVWISNNGVTTAVEADDVSIDGSNYTICGIKWNGSAWDYTDAGKGGSGGGLPSYTSADNGKVLTVVGDNGSTVTAYSDTLELSAEGQGLLLNFAVPQNEWIVGRTTGMLSWLDGQGRGNDIDLTAQEYEGYGVVLGNDTYNVAVVYTNGVYGVSIPDAASKQISLVITVTQAPTAATISWESAGGGASEIVYIGQRQFGNAADYAMLDEPGGNKLNQSQCEDEIESLIGKSVTLRKGTDDSHTDYSGYFAEHNTSVLVFIDTSGGTPTLKTAGYLENVH